MEILTLQKSPQESAGGPGTSTRFKLGSDRSDDRAYPCFFVKGAVRLSASRSVDQLPAGRPLDDRKTLEEDTLERIVPFVDHGLASLEVGNRFADGVKLLHGAVCLIDRDVGVSMAIRIRICNRNAAKWLAPNHARTL